MLISTSEYRLNMYYHKYIKGGWDEMVLCLFSHAASGRTIGNSLKLLQGRLRLDIRTNFFTDIGAGCPGRL